MWKLESLGFFSTFCFRIDGSGSLSLRGSSLRLVPGLMGLEVKSLWGSLRLVPGLIGLEGIRPSPCLMFPVLRMM